MSIARTIVIMWLGACAWVTTSIVVCAALDSARWRWRRHRRRWARACVIHEAESILRNAVKDWEHEAARP